MTMPDVVTTILDALAIVVVATGVAMVAATSTYGFWVAWRPEWLAVSVGTVVGGLTLGIGSWVAGRTGGRT